MSIVKSGIIVGLLTLASRLFGFVRDIFISASLGASMLTDVFNVAFRLPNFFRRIFAEGAFNSAFIPIFSGKLAAEGEIEAKKFANEAFTVLLIILFFFICLMEIIMPVFIYILAPGFAKNIQGHEFQLAVTLSRITMPYLLFISIVSLIGGILNSHGKFIAAAASPIFLNIVMIASLLGLKDFVKTEAHALSWGVFLSGITQLILISIPAIRNNLMVKLQIPRFSNSIKKLFKNMIPGIIGGGVMQINLIVDQALASFLPAGSLSLLMYADRINQLPLALIGTAIGTVLLPTLSKHLRKNQKDEANNMQNRSIEIALFLTLPATLALIIAAKPIVYTIYERGAFTHDNTIGVVEALVGFVFGLPAYVLVKVFAPSFFAIEDTKTPVKISMICVAINIILSLIFIGPLSHIGIALATSCSSWINAGLLLYLMIQKRLITFDMLLKKRIAKILFSCLFMGMAVLLYEEIFYDQLFSINNFTRFIYLCGMIMFGIITYFIAIIISKTFDLKSFKKYFKK